MVPFLFYFKLIIQQIICLHLLKMMVKTRGRILASFPFFQKRVRRLADWDLLPTNGFHGVR